MSHAIGAAGIPIAPISRSFQLFLCRLEKATDGPMSKPFRRTTKVPKLGDHSPAFFAPPTAAWVRFGSWQFQDRKTRCCLQAAEVILWSYQTSKLIYSCFFRQKKKTPALELVVFLCLRLGLFASEVAHLHNAWRVGNPRPSEKLHCLGESSEVSFLTRLQVRFGLSCLGFYCRNWLSRPRKVCTKTWWKSQESPLHNDGVWPENPDFIWETGEKSGPTTWLQNALCTQRSWFLAWRWQRRTLACQTFC